MTGGKIFVEAVATSGWRINGPQTVFFRQVNCEQDPSNSVDDNGTPTYIFNSGATIWAFGLKSERELTTITTRNGGKTEVLSGLQYPAREVSSTAPLFIVENASASFSYGTESFWIGGDYQIQVRETRGGLTREFRSSLSSYPVKALPRNNGSMVPLFSAIASASVTNGTYRLINKYSAKALDVSFAPLRMTHERMRIRSRTTIECSDKRHSF